MEQSTPDVICPAIIRMLRAQRHDFVNHIQVAHALLQLGKVDQAKDYLESVAKNTDMVAETLRLHAKEGACHLKDE
ncbi:sensor histidine kinase regulating citrate/malate metabolism [Sporomusaceae bacterium BoRhaA]|uniref:Spo0B domain-containing protein n=1 Tax=Pelorhabdus rhamnosifermentans TaxID=2772457 RepID=UPI001C05F7F5|nr:Spo0B domain-containing protein [Pelorhabdus rhamnosifermentans]MBU2699795.1 sensor histidine kinase regulating citrate/malate metabolism [Pelorhabdus rhamnosifermentans]